MYYKKYIFNIVTGEIRESYDREYTNILVNKYPEWIPISDNEYKHIELAIKFHQKEGDENNSN